jgi:hypothetical protein
MFSGCCTICQTPASGFVLKSADQALRAGTRAPLSSLERSYSVAQEIPRRTRPSALSLRIIVPPLWMPELNLRSIEPLVPLSLYASEMHTDQKEKTIPYRSHGSDKAMRCAVCEGKFGLVRHYSWRTQLCSRKYADHFKARRQSNHNWMSWFLIAFDQALYNRARAS